jgi:hypothetical protein
MLFVRAYAERIELRQDGRVVGEHRRSFGRDHMVFDAWHYVPVLARKPGAWRNGTPLKDWLLPGALERVPKPPRRIPAGPGRVAPLRSGQASGQHHAAGIAAQMPGAERDGEQLAVHARQLAVQPRVPRPRWYLSTIAATPGPT